jgi:hypothetical protein
MFKDGLILLRPQGPVSSNVGHHAGEKKIDTPKFYLTKNLMFISYNNTFNQLHQ